MSFTALGGFVAADDLQQQVAALTAEVEELNEENASLVEDLQNESAFTEDVEQTLATTIAELFGRLQFAVSVLTSVAVYGGEDPVVQRNLALAALDDIGTFVAENTFDPETVVANARLAALINLGVLDDMLDDVIVVDLSGVAVVPVGH